MIIDFDKLQKEEKANFKSGDGVVVFFMFKDERNSIFKIVLNPNCSVGFHKHENSQEIMYLLDGNVEVIDDDKTYILEKGQIAYCGENHSHGIKNTGKTSAILICSVTTF